MKHNYTNQLIDEKSPYLQQHAHNPVDWMAWGEKAFGKARKEDKPIFLSIGYSTCHWCHVMEKESFENAELAKILNQYFVSIKVDREERPDIDHIYMNAVQAMTGQGGWPLSAFLTHDLKPFYGGTYFPPDDRWGRPGFGSVLEAIARQWQSDRDKLIRSAEAVAQAIQIKPKKVSSSTFIIREDILKEGFEQFLGQFDPENGGFGSAPKFPRSHVLSFLLRWWRRSKNAQALEMVEKTLLKMAQGGMHDQLGGGFHRYSVDDIWRISHFEKMLYDQAILSKSYLEAYQVTKNEMFACVAREIFDYVLRDMTHAEGGFYSAEDADSASNPSEPEEKTEGAFYLWTVKEVLELLGPDDGKVFNEYFGVLVDGNAPHDPHGEFLGKNVLYISKNSDEVAKHFQKRPEEIVKIIEEGKKKLLKARAQRLRPHLDDKILTDWNGLMIASLAFGGRVLKEEKYIKSAQKSADFILTRMRTKEGRLLHRYRNGEAAISAFLDDYAFFIDGLLELYQATFHFPYLKEAVALAKDMIHFFRDETEGGFFFLGKDSEKLMSQTQEIYDGALPSGNSIAALVLLKLSKFTMNVEMERQAQSLFQKFSELVSQFPSGYPQMLIAIDFALGPTQEVVIAGALKDKEFLEMTHEIYSHFIPNMILAYALPDQKSYQDISTTLPFVKGKEMLKGKATVYICQNYSCKAPITDLKELRESLS